VNLAFQFLGGGFGFSSDWQGWFRAAVFGRARASGFQGRPSGVILGPGFQPRAQVVFRSGFLGVVVGREADGFGGDSELPTVR
jgi:hypothetical protein